MHPVAKIWSNAFQAGQMAVSLSGLRPQNLLRIPRAWRKILRHTGTVPPARILEAGCGCGGRIIPLAAGGFRVVGIDCSLRALKEGARIIRTLESGYGFRGKIDLVCGDFLEGCLWGRFSLVFHQGVVEHYLSRSDRLNFLAKMFSLAEEGGYVVSVVPSGVHPFRGRLKRERLGGYDIPEIDYSPAELIAEAESCGGREIAVFGHDLLGYLNVLPGGRMRKLFFRGVYLVFQLIPSGLLKRSFRERHAYSLVCVARKVAR